MNKSDSEKTLRCAMCLCDSKESVLVKCISFDNDALICVHCLKKIEKGVSSGLV